MKILRLNSISGETGGVERYIENTNAILKEKQHEIVNITLLAGTKSYTPNNVSNIIFEVNPYRRLIADQLVDKNLLDRLISTVEQFEPDIIHLHHFRIAFRTVFQFLSSISTPVVFTAHDALAVCPLSTLVRPGDVICNGGISARCGFTGCKIHGHLPYELMLSRYFKAISKSKIKAFICPSYSIMNYLISNGFGPSVHLPSYSNFDSNSLTIEPEYDKILLNRNIGFIGRIEWYKGIDDLIKGFAIFSKNHPDFNLLIAGSGPFTSNLKRLASNLEIDKKVRFMGTIDKAGRDEFYGSLFCNVVPSKYWENFALSAQESMLRGIPTIGTNIGGIPEIIRNWVTGFTVPISSPNEISKALEIILQNKNNQILDIMKNGRSFILNNLTPEKHIEGLLDIYQKVLKGEDIPNGYDENFISYPNSINS